MKNPTKRILQKENLTGVFILLVTIVFVGNLFAYLSIYFLTGVNAFNSDEVTAYKYEKLPETFRENATNLDTIRPCEFPHPYFGTLKTCGNEIIPGEESLFTARKNADSNTKKILIVGGSVAKHFSTSNSEDVAYFQGRKLMQPDILEKVLLAKLPNNVFNIYNAAIPGGKQPQQLFLLNYLLLMGYEFDIVINIDGYNEVVFPLVENLPNGLWPHYPRRHDRRIYKMAQIPDCALTLQEMAASHSKIPILEFISDIEFKMCLKELNSPITDGFNSIVRGSINFPENMSIDEAFGLAKLYWERSSEAMYKLSQVYGFIYLHVLQPNQHVYNSKQLSEKEEEIIYPVDIYMENTQTSIMKCLTKIILTSRASRNLTRGSFLRIRLRHFT